MTILVERIGSSVESKQEIGLEHIGRSVWSEEDGVEHAVVMNWTRRGFCVKSEKRNKVSSP